MLKNLTVRNRILLGAGITLLPFIFLGVLSSASIHSLLTAIGLVNRTNEVVSEASQLNIAALNMETGGRGYLLAGREEFKEPFELGLKNFQAHVATLRDAIKDDAAQTSLLKDMEQQIISWRLNAMIPAITLREEIGDAPTMNDIAHMVGKSEGLVFFNRFRETLKAFTDEEAQILNERLGHAQRP